VPRANHAAPRTEQCGAGGLRDLEIVDVRSSSVGSTLSTRGQPTSEPAPEALQRTFHLALQPNAITPAEQTRLRTLRPDYNRDDFLVQPQVHPPVCPYAVTWEADLSQRYP